MFICSKQTVNKLNALSRDFCLLNSKQTLNKLKNGICLLVQTNKHQVCLFTNIL